MEHKHKCDIHHWFDKNWFKIVIAVCLIMITVSIVFKTTTGPRSYKMHDGFTRTMMIDECDRCDNCEGELLNMDVLDLS